MNTSKFNLSIQGSKMTTNRFIGTKSTKRIKFMSQDLDINKLTITQVMKVQQRAKELENSSDTEQDNLRLLALVVQEGAPDLKELSMEELYEFPMDDLSSLSNEIMKFSGLGNKDTK